MSGMLASPASLHAAAVVLGVGLGVGLWSTGSALVQGRELTQRRVSAPAIRIAHALRDISPVARDDLRPVQYDPVSILGVVVTPAVAGIVRWMHRLLGGQEAATVLLARAGVSYGETEYRFRRVAWALCGAALGFALMGLLVATRGQPLGTGIVGALVAGVIGAVAGAGSYDRRLGRLAAARQQRLAEEFPSVLELLALALAAGESLPGALRRIADRGSGELAREWARVMRRVELGEPLAQALRESAVGLGVPEIQSLVEHLATALERGAPLAEVVRSHSADSRHDQLRGIVERAGKAEVWMLVPLVLLILPTTVIFAIWPSLQALQTGL